MVDIRRKHIVVVVVEVQGEDKVVDINGKVMEFQGEDEVGDNEGRVMDIDERDEVVVDVEGIRCWWWWMWNTETVAFKRLEEREEEWTHENARVLRFAVDDAHVLDAGLGDVDGQGRDRRDEGGAHARRQVHTEALRH